MLNDDLGSAFGQSRKEGSGGCADREEAGRGGIFGLLRCQTPGAYVQAPTAQARDLLRGLSRLPGLDFSSYGRQLRFHNQMR